MTCASYKTENVVGAGLCIECGTALVALSHMFPRAWFERLGTGQTGAAG